MTQLYFLILTTLFLWVNNSVAKIPLCEEQDSRSSPCNQVPYYPVSLAGSLTKLETKLWISSELETMQDIYRQKKDLYANMFRLIENSQLDNKKLEPKIQQEIHSTLEDFQSLFFLSQTIHSLSSKLQICYQGKCGPTRRLELEDQLSSVQKSKTYLLIKRPLLTHPDFENYLKENHEHYPDSRMARKIISNASRETAAKLLEKVDQYGRFIDSESSDLPPEIADDFVSRFEMSGIPPGKNAWLCSLATKREKERNQDALLKTGIETTLFVAPLLLGPWGRVGVFGLEGILGARLLRFGMSAREIENAAWLTRATTGLGANISQSLEVKKIGKACQVLEQKFLIQSSAQNFEQLSQCKTDYNDSVFISTLGWITAIAPDIPGPALKFYRTKFTPQLIETKTSVQQIGNVLQRNPLEKNQWARDFTTPDQGHFTYMDLSKIERVTDHQMRQVPDDYWKFVGEIYSERLNLTPEEIKGFIKSSQEFAPRTKLIINTTEAARDAKTFKGGVGVVITDKLQDLLPAEKAIGKNLQRKPADKVAEIVRLTVSKDADAEKLSRSLLSQAAGVILQDPEIKFVYVYTSKVHGRLYKRFGVTQSQITPQGDRDVIITMSRGDLEKMLASAHN